MSGPTKRTGTGRDACADDARWQAVVARDREARGSFVYAVVTTGIYCRPGCSSRRPNRENVRFYASPAAAERDGFRACKRCEPKGEEPRNARTSSLVSEACRRLVESEDEPKLEDLAREAGLSPYHFHRLFKSITGLTPKSYALAIREERVRTGLAGGAHVTAALHDAGYGSAGRFYANAKGVLGMRPGDYRRGGAGHQIAYAIAPCTLGHVLVAATTDGICAILLGADGPALEADLKARFVKAHIEKGGADFVRLISGVVAHVDQPAAPFDLPLDVRGTAFQQKVWNALRAIPAGATATYAEIAGKIGNPRAVRAVARACASNPVAVVIPCHRVVGKDGSLTGYRWGIERKRALLERERELAERGRERGGARPAPRQKRKGP